MDVRQETTVSTEIAALLQEHLDEMKTISPPESVHALDFEALRAPNITFWSAWEGDEILGCGALKEIDATSGEIKSMRTANAHRRKGVAATILESILEEAVRRNYERLFLETGSQDEFVPARTLYERYGFAYCGPFTGYVDDPNSVFMTKVLGG